MAERRSLSTAMSTPVPGVDNELVRSFVTQNKPFERPVAEPPKPLDTTREAKNDLVGSVEKEPIESKPVRQKPKKANRFQPVGLIPVTVRLKPEIAGALKRASLERELEGEEVFTQQDLVEQALEPWLQKHGFMD